MLRLLALTAAIVGLLSLTPSAPDASAVPPDPSDLDCLGPLRSALVRSGSTVVARDPATGEEIELDGSSNPGQFRGASGVDELLALFPSLERDECALLLLDLTSCVDFDLENPCYPGDADGDLYLDFLEVRVGSDTNNAASTPESALLDEQTSSNTCGDRVDNDLDGGTDNGDAGCRLTCDDFGHSDRCADPDGDGWLTYVEEMRGSDPNDPASIPENIGDCVDFDSGIVCEPF